MPAFTIGDCISYGWDTFKKRPGILIGAVLLTMIIPALPGVIVPGPEVTPGELPPPPTLAQIVATFVSAILGLFMAIGAVTVALRAHDDVGAVTLSDIWNPQPFWRFLGAHILVAIGVLIGLMLLVIPGIILAVGLTFVPYLIVDRGAGIVQSLQDSWRLTKGHKLQLFFLMLTLLGLNIVGLLCFIVGILVTVPITWVAVAHAYRTLSSAHAAS